MSNFIKIAVLAPAPPNLNGRPADNSAADDMVGRWGKKAEQVLPDNPDIIITPECSDRYGDLPEDKRSEYYELRGERTAEFWRKTAKENDCFIAYSAVRKTEKGFFNSTEIIDRSGNTAGTYRKNYPTTGEMASGIIPGAEAPLIDCGFGKIACAICFDLNFDELRLRYAARKPDIILFSSMYHGGLMQNYWAYSCGAHFTGAIAPPGCRGSVISPVGKLLAETTNYYDFIVHTVNLDCGVYHIDFNGEKFSAIKKKYGPDVTISDPGLLGSVLISAETEGLSIGDVQEEFSLEPLNNYFKRAADKRTRHLDR
jgi:predicted amidohydrolase